MRAVAHAVVLVAVGGALAPAASPVPQVPADPFAFFKPEVTLTPEERRAIDRGEARVKILSHGERDVAVFGVTPVNISADRLVAWVRRIERMKESPATLAVGRFSDPPRLADLDRLTIDDDEMWDVQQCRPGDCHIRLSAEEMARLRREVSGPTAQWRPRMQGTFRQILLERVLAYQARGFAGLPTYEDKAPSRQTADAFNVVFEQSRSLRTGLPQFAAALQGPPSIPPGVESFYYWAKERLSGKPVISATHVSIIRPESPGSPAVLVVGKQIFATHYFTGAISVTALLRGAPGGHNYLAYLNRSEVDVIGGMFGGVARMLIQRRVRGEAAELLEGLRKRLEAGEPKGVH
jgi:hypothetical protein